MRKVQFYGAISIDGYLATKDNRLDWLFQTPGANDAPTEAFMQQVDTAIMGRHTYEYTWNKRPISSSILTIQRLATL